MVRLPSPLLCTNRITDRVRDAPHASADLIERHRAAGKCAVAWAPSRVLVFDFRGLTFAGSLFFLRLLPFEEASAPPSSSSGPSPTTRPRGPTRRPCKPSSSRFRSSASCSRATAASPLRLLRLLVDVHLVADGPRQPNTVRDASPPGCGGRRAPASTASSSSFVRAASLARSRSWRLPSPAAAVRPAATPPNPLPS